MRLPFKTKSSCKMSLSKTELFTCCFCYHSCSQNDETVITATATIKLCVAKILSILKGQLPVCGKLYFFSFHKQRILYLLTHECQSIGGIRQVYF